MDTLETLTAERDSLLRRIAAVQKASTTAKANEILDRMKSTAQEMVVAQNTDIYTAFMEQKAYVDAMRQNIEQNGTSAKSERTGADVTFQLAQDGTAKTFCAVPVGDALTTSAGVTYLIKSFNHSYVSSTLDLVACNAAVKVHAEGSKPTPFTVPARMDGATITLAKALQAGEVVTYAGKTLRPTASYPYQLPLYVYDVEEVANA